MKGYTASHLYLFKTLGCWLVLLYVFQQYEHLSFMLFSWNFNSNVKNISNFFFNLDYIV